MNNVKCEKCGYEWSSSLMKNKNQTPKQCVLCKRYFSVKKINLEEKNKDGFE